MLIEKRTFLNAKSVGSNRTIADLEFVRCEFVGSSLSQFDDPRMGLVVRDVTATRCESKRSFCAGVCFENVLVDGLTTSSALDLKGCVFRRVIIRGRVGSWSVTQPNTSLDADVQNAFILGIVQYYRDVDWALDISEAQFDSASLHFVPGGLVRRDPETQFLIRRDAVADVDVNDLPIYARIAISRFEGTPFDSLVAVAPKRSKKFAEIKSHYQELRDRKLAE